MSPPHGFCLKIGCLKTTPFESWNNFAVSKIINKLMPAFKPNALSWVVSPLVKGSRHWSTS